MRRSSTVLAVTVAALASGAAAHAQQPDPPPPTFAFGGSCFTEQQHIPFNGGGYTPGGDVFLIFTSGSRLRGYTTHADGAGMIDDYVAFDSADELLNPDEGRAPINVTANDETRIDAGQQPLASTFAIADFTFTRWAGFGPTRFVPGKRANVEAYGWAFATGQEAWLLFRKGSRTVASVSMGHLDAGCGDRKATIKVPRRLKAGRYRAYITTDRTLHGPYTWMSVRVVARRASAAMAPRREMRRWAIAGESAR
jgi:hypothetical protein